MNAFKNRLAKLKLKLNEGNRSINNRSTVFSDDAAEYQRENTMTLVMIMFQVTNCILQIDLLVIKLRSYIAPS